MTDRLRDFAAQHGPPERPTRALRRCEDCGRTHALVTGRERTCEDCADAEADAERRAVEDWARVGRGE